MYGSVSIKEWLTPDYNQSHSNFLQAHTLHPPLCSPNEATDLFLQWNFHANSSSVLNTQYWQKGNFAIHNVQRLIYVYAWDLIIGYRYDECSRVKAIESPTVGWLQPTREWFCRTRQYLHDISITKSPQLYKGLYILKYKCYCYLIRQLTHSFAFQSEIRN